LRNRKRCRCFLFRFGFLISSDALHMGNYRNWNWNSMVFGFEDRIRFVFLESSFRSWERESEFGRWGESVGERKEQSKRSRPWPFKNKFSVIFYFPFFYCFVVVVAVAMILWFELLLQTCPNGLFLSNNDKIHMFNLFRIFLFS
jgi:hypothetical protein